MTLPAVVLLVLAVANACILLVPETPLASIAAGLLVLLIPGTGIVLALQHKLRGLEAVLWAIGCSLAVVALLALVLEVLPWGISKIGWLVSIDVVALIVLALAWREHPDPVRLTSPLPRPETRQIVAALVLVVAVAIATLGVVLGVRGARSAERSEPFVQLWSVPQGSQMLVGARSAVTGAPRDYRLTVFREDQEVRSYAFTLGWGESWQTQTPVPSGGAVYRTILTDADGNVLRRVRVTLPGS